MRILLHDYSGHPFQAQLSAELAASGHEVTHSYCAAYLSGKGNLDRDVHGLAVEPIARGSVIDKHRFGRRLVQELGFGIALARQALRHRPDAVIIANTPVPAMLVFVLYLMSRRIPWILWHQDVQGVAIRSFAGEKLHSAFLAAAWVIEAGERWCARRAAAIVVIAESFLDVHRRWGTVGKVTVIPNWAPLDEIVPLNRHNDWSAQQGLNQAMTLLYSGTLGLKHNPGLLVALAERVRHAGAAVHLVVVNEGEAVPVIREAARRLDVPVTILPFQPYDRLSEVLASGDILVVLLDRSAGAFSVPSKTLSYLCAGRPVLGLMPTENLAAQLVSEAGGCVLPPEERALDEAAAWAVAVLNDETRRRELGRSSRELAERDFAVKGAAERFDTILRSIAAV